LPEAAGRLCPSADHRPPAVPMGVSEHTFGARPRIRRRRCGVCGVHSGASVGRVRPAWAGRPKGEADMIPASFDYAVARDVGHAIQLLGTSGGEGKVLAGGQSLIPLMKFRLAQPALLIDINRVAGLSAIKENGDLRIGALVRENDLEANPIVRQRYPIVVETAAVIADPLVRNLATIGGNLAHADRANDHPATMLAVRASVVAQGPKGQRVIPIDELFVDTFTTSLPPDDILTHILIPKPPPRSGDTYLKLDRKSGDFATAGPQEGRFPHSHEARDRQSDRAGEGRCLMAVETAPATTTGTRRMKIHVTVNGQAHDVEVETRTLLVHFLRENLGMTGTHIGCDTTNCGACTVLLNGRPVKSCTVFAVQADGMSVATVEGLEKDGKLDPVQEGFHEEHGLQCGF